MQQYRQAHKLMIKGMACSVKYLHELLLCRSSGTILLHLCRHILCLQNRITLSQYQHTLPRTLHTDDTLTVTFCVPPGFVLFNTDPKTYDDPIKSLKV